jgi:DNA repair and recombination protein RAD54 and RAD54-like protein
MDSSSTGSTDQSKSNRNSLSSKSISSREDEDSGDITISRMPLFGFLEIPEALNKQFKIPSGCLITEKSLELRKVKTLGPSRKIQIIQPGHYMPPLPKSNSQENTQVEDDEGCEDLPTAVSNSIPSHEPLVLWTDPNNNEKKVAVAPELCYRLRPHQREGVSFLFECTMGLRGFDGCGCILADDMGLGKTFMSITLIWTLMNQGFQGESAIRKVIVACPTSLVGNWDREIKFWIDGKCETFPVKSEPKRIIKNFLSFRGKGVLIVSYETQRRYSKMFENEFKRYQSMNKTSSSSSAAGGGGGGGKGTEEDPLKAEYNGVCELLICDEAHKLKNADCGLHESLIKLPAKKRILLSGTPMQNELLEFYNLVNFCNPNILGSPTDFKKKYERIILRARELDAPESDIKKAALAQKELSTIVNEFILKRGNILNAKHLPPKLVQYLTIPLTSLQEKLYDCVINSKEVRHIRDGKQSNTLNCIRMLINICNHPQLIYETYLEKLQNREKIDDEFANLAKIFESEVKVVSNGNKKVLPPLNPELSGKLFVLFRLMQTMKSLNTGEKIVIISNYTQTLDLIQQMCTNNKWAFCRLDGSTNASKRTKIVEDFNSSVKSSSSSSGGSGSASKYGSVNSSSVSSSSAGAFAFLLSSKAGGCGINLIGANRLVLFDPDWNPASDKQAAGRVWREGQQRRCYLYRFMTQGSIEEKIIQRQISKEGLTNVVDNTDPFATFDSSELKQLFVLNQTSKSDTHDSLRCKRCKSANASSNSATGGGGGLKKGAANQPLLTPPLIELCIKFLDDFYQVVLNSNESESESSKEKLVSYLEDLSAPKTKLAEKIYKTIPEFSREIRNIMLGIDGNISNDSDDAKEGEMNAADCKLSLSIGVHDEFVQRWTLFVPTLTAARKKEMKEAKEALAAAKSSKSSSKDNGDESEDSDEEENQCVEQEGCPEESDLNRWSHHGSIQTCDDEILKKAFIDDSTYAPTFIFGLEVNFQLLEENEELKKVANEKRKAERDDDIRVLNEDRKKNKIQTTSSNVTVSASVSTNMGLGGLLGDLIGGESSADVRKGENKSRKAEKSARVPINDSETDSDEVNLAKHNNKREKEKEKEVKSKNVKDSNDSPIFIDARIPTSRSGRVIHNTQRFDPLKVVPATEEYQMDSIFSASKEKKHLSVRPLNSGSLSRLDLLAATDIDDGDSNRGWGTVNPKSSAMAIDSATKAASKLNRKSRSEVVEAEMIIKFQNQKNASLSSISRSRHVIEEDESNDDILASPEKDSFSIGADKTVIHDKNQRKRAKVIDDDDDSDGIIPVAVTIKANKSSESNGKLPCNAIFSPPNKENNINSDTWPDSSNNDSDHLDSASQSSKNKPAMDLTEEIKLSQNQWSCLACTFINDKRVNSICCNICGEPKPRQKSKVSLKDLSKSSIRR